MWAAFPPLGWGPLAFVAPVPFFWAIRRVERAGEAVALGFLWGATFFGVLLWWIFVLGAVAWIPLTIFLASWFAAYAFAVWAFRLWPAWRWWLVATAGWGLMEFLRARFPFGGFPWGSVGYAAAGNGPALGSVQWVGPAGWSLVTIAFASGVALLLEDRENWRFPVDSAVTVLLLVLAGSLFPPRTGGPALRVAIVQGSSPCPQVHCQNESRRIYESHLRLTRSIPAGGADLVIWGENATGPPYEPEGNDTVRSDIIEEAGRIGAYLLVSGTRNVGDDRFLNVNVLFSPEGVKLGEYAKRHPVPFGEYVPLRGLLGFIPQLDQVPRDMVRGTAPVVFPLAEGRLGSVISFEGAFARSMRAAAVGGAQAVVVATNEGSFGEGPASDQLIGLVRVNAAAVGQDVAVAAITGRSTFVTADGTVGERTGLFEEAILYGILRMRASGPTFYTRFGDWTLLLALVLMAAAVLWPGEGGLERFLTRRGRP